VESEGWGVGEFGSLKVVYTFESGTARADQPEGSHQSEGRCSTLHSYSLLLRGNCVSIIQIPKSISDVVSVSTPHSYRNFALLPTAFNVPNPNPFISIFYDRTFLNTSQSNMLTIIVVLKMMKK
jgi:hypothetical protein